MTDPYTDDYCRGCGRVNPTTNNPGGMTTLADAVLDALLDDRPRPYVGHTGCQWWRHDHGPCPNPKADVPGAVYCRKHWVYRILRREIEWDDPDGLEAAAELLADYAAGRPVGWEEQGTPPLQGAPSLVEQLSGVVRQLNQFVGGEGLVGWVLAAGWGAWPSVNQRW